jgi:hypothetical protein
MDVNKIAKKDAFDWARAEMFFGAGAGTRRKLLNAQIEDKVAKIPGYVELFEDWYGKQNFADHAIAAAKERKRIDRLVSLKRNGKGLLTGNRKQLSTAVLVGVTTYVILHETGYDVVIQEHAKTLYGKSKVAFLNAFAGEKKVED